MPKKNSAPSGPSRAISSRGKPAARTTAGEKPDTLFPIVGIGASAGGLEAFSELLHAVPADTGMAFVLVQHLDPSHGSMLTEIMARATAMPVSEVRGETDVLPNQVYVGPPGMDLTIDRGVLKIAPRTETRGQHRSIDHFLRSLAADQAHQAIGVILSGSATDGTLGLQEIKAEGGITFAQDDTAKHDSMPRSAIAAGCVDFVLSPKRIGQELARIARHPYVAPEASTVPAAEISSLAPVLEILNRTLGVDFSHYKHNTLYRRVTRRMVLHKKDELQDYVRLLEESPGEVEALYQDVLINVTSFFRNPEAFDVLRSNVFPRLTKDRSRHEPVRIWVLGCSTGEEAYSIAIAFSEFCTDAARQIPLQIFATDLNGTSIEKARAGIYAKNIAHDVSPERLRRFFSEVDGSYSVRKSIRDMCVFARHNVLSEPPFSRMDLITCRNLLIYLDGEVQQRVVPILHYALQPSGFLWLGTSETIGSYRDLFEVEDVKHKVYAKKPGMSRVVLGGFSRGHSLTFVAGAKPAPPREQLPTGIDSLKEAERILLAKYAPPSILINGDMDILQFRGDTGLYLTPAPGRASLNLLKMLREGLMVAVRGAVQKAKRKEVPVREPNLRVKSNGGYRELDVEVIPVKGSSVHEGCFLILFEERLTPSTKHTAIVEGPAPRDVALEVETEREDLRLKQELAATREYLQSVIEQQEAANEELQSANEEVQSANEELQSINEELETSKEEIQSSNEELATVNEELHNRNVELSQTNNDLINLLSSVQMAIVMLGPDLRIRRFTPMAERMMNLIPADVGRPIKDLNMQVEIEDLEHLLEEVIDTVSVKEYEVRDKQGRWYSLRLRPYRTADNKIDGAVIVLFDVDALKRTDETLRRQAELLEHAYEPITIWALDTGVISYWNRAAEETYGYTREQALGRTIHELLLTDVSATAFKPALETQGRWTGDLTHAGRDQQLIEVESRMMLVVDPEGHRMVIETSRPIGERKRMEHALRERAEQLASADRAKNEFLAMLGHELRNPLAPLRNAAEILRQSTNPDPALLSVRNMIVRQVNSMARMVDDLLDVARITGHGLDLRKSIVDLSSVIGHAVETARLEFERRNQILSVALPDEPIYVDGDAVRLEQVVDNLLVNASKFTGDGGHAWISLEHLAPGAEPGTAAARAKITVRDDGTGISANMLPHIFDLFMQGQQSLDRAQGGLGIGLTLVKQLVDLHGGSVQAFSKGHAQGSEFTVYLPAVPAGMASMASVTPEHHSAPRQHSPRKVLIVDDNVDSALSLRMLLELDGHQVELAHDGPMGLQKAEQLQPEVVLLDIGLPGMDGYEIARRLRHKGVNGMWLVAVSGYGQDEHRRAAQQAGFDHYLVKPVDFEAFRDLMDSLPQRVNSG
jgi:two-component system CheB/CheR fusion protein